MKCPYCGEQESKVIDSRHTDDMLSIRRRRECANCLRRFTTHEKVEDMPVLVVKRDGSRQEFDRRKIINSILHAFDKRRVDADILERIAVEIEQAVQNTLDREIPTEDIGAMVLERLKPVDEIAYIRFASIYHRFTDAQSFREFLEENE